MAGKLGAAPVGEVYPFFPVTGSGDWGFPVSKAKELIKELSVDEKVAIVTGIGWANGPCVGNIHPVPKIQFPGLCLQDGPAGIRFADNVTVFGASINVAATFDKDLMEQHGQLLGKEFRQKGVNIALAPAMNLARTPEGGRNWEGQGADPYLAAISASLQIKGIQSQGVIATAKHFIGNEQEHAREKSSSDIDDRTLHEIYLPPFEASIKAGVGAIMCAYNLVNGTYACENPHLLHTVLRGELDFNGFVMTDWWAGMSGRETALGGSDMMMAGETVWGAKESYWGPNLVRMVNDGSVPMSRLDDMVTRILAAWLKMGQDKDFPPTNFDSFDPSKGSHVDVRGDHAEHVRKVGAASTVLLKNQGVLPLNKVKTVAVLGSDARTPEDPNKFADRGGVDGTVALGWGSGTANFTYLVGPYDGILSQATPQGINVTHSFDDWDVTKAVETAKQADVAIVCVAADSGEGYITVEGNAGDRNNLTLWNNGDALVQAVADANPNTIVVIHSPGAITMPWIQHPNIKAVVMALMPGQESGNSLADVLFGKTNPSGRLPFTINTAPEEYGAHVQYHTNVPVDTRNRCIPETCPHIAYSEGLLADYRYNEAKSIEPLFGFGHGLSYTSFKYSGLAISSTGPSARVSVTVTNTGTVPGHEVIQLYLRSPPVAQKPFKELKGFSRVFLEAGQSTTVDFDLSERDCSFWSDGWKVAQGTFEVLIGASSRDMRVNGTFVI
ncbi:hypothetical protein SpCBS45565_g04171 [Spizellomyces sp. 'palustris']|nr:hypothetical protein SpCBS45565_g04171 [Spizellomyces sp. 'palustris']